MNGYFDLKMALAPVWQGDDLRPSLRAGRAGT